MRGSGAGGWSKLHVDGSLIEADAAKESVIKGAPQLIAALKRAYGATESKLEQKSQGQSWEPPVNERMMSQSDPDATLTHQGSGESRPRYKHHRVVDDSKGVITALETTPGAIAENKKLMGLAAQHEKNTQCQTQIVVADCQYGTSENFVACQERGITTHMGDAASKVRRGHDQSLFGEEAFTYDRRAKNDVYWCPAGQKLERRFRWKRFVAGSNTRPPPECVGLVPCVPNAPVLSTWLYGSPARKTTPPGYSARSGAQRGGTA